jgi:hypothetical protein
MEQRIFDGYYGFQPPFLKPVEIPSNFCLYQALMFVQIFANSIKNMHYTFLGSQGIFINKIKDNNLHKGSKWRLICFS